MRLIKENTVQYESFSKSLQYFTKISEARGGELKLINFETQQSRESQFEKFNYFVQNIYGFQKKIIEHKSALEINALFSSFVKRIIAAKEADLFLFDASKRNLVSINTNVSSTQNNLVNKAYKNGILDWIFETRKPTLVPDLNSYTSNGIKLAQTIFPVIYHNNKLGVLSLLGTTSKISEESAENQTVQILLGIIIPQLMTIRQKEQITKLYDEVQLYQSKINNDFRVNAVGEYAEGIIQDMMNSLQVILSNVDLIENDYADVDEKIIEDIKNRIKILRDLSQGLLKFNEVKSAPDKQNLPCDINGTIHEFYEVLKPTLKTLELECELGLEENIPPILTSSKQIKQILTNIFSLIKKKTIKGSGIFIQTRYVHDAILVSFYIADYWKDFKTRPDYITSLTIKIVRELMKMNEGTAEFESMPMKGTSIHLLFPLKRKLKQ
ncbi:MAG: HAMP domain-containing histidine kinase [Ignavibacteriales bacterium]|nr:HAMP domain-containing histidine kinase [Ignavibacteriales bacterium]